MKVWLSLLLAGSLFAGDGTVLRREGEYWVEVTRGALPPKLTTYRVVTTGGIVAHGSRDAGGSYQVTKKVRARSEAEARRLLRGVAVTSHAVGESGRLNVLQPVNHPAYIDLEVMVPRILRNTILTTRGGNVTVTDVVSSVQVESAAGTIDLDRISGNAFAKTGGGEIRAGAIGGTLRCESSGGSIRAGKVNGETRLETAGGEILIGESIGPVYATTLGGNIRVEHAGSEVTARTAAGRIEVQQARGIVNADNSGGSIEVGSAAGVRCESSRGAIRLRGTSGSLRALSDVGNILAELTSAVQLADSELTTGAGDVTILIPSNFPLTVKAQSERGRAARVVSEFPEFRAQKASATPASITEGCVNGCGPVLRISANGTIYLRRQR